MAIEEKEDFATLLAEYEQREPTPRRQNLPAVGDKVSGKVVSIGREAVFVALGAKAEAVLDRDQVVDSDGNLQVSVGDTIEARVAEIRSGQIVLRTSIGRGPDARAELAQAHAHGIPVEGVVSAAIKGGVEVQVAGVRAFCPISQLDDRYVEDAGEYVGKRYAFRITRYETGRGNQVNLVLSRRVLLDEEKAIRAQETREKLKVGAVLPGRVTSIKGYGAFVDLGGIEGMLHISELGFGRVEHPSDVVSVGQSLDVQIIKIEKTNDPKRPEKIGLSLKALAADPWDEARKRFSDGSQVRGTVARLEAYGAFVELLPGVEGLVHVSELGAGRRVNHAREVVKIGDEVDVVVLGFDLPRRRISLSIKAAKAGEEAAVAASYDRPKSSGFGTIGDLLKKKL